LSADGVGGKVDVHVARQRIGHNQRRRGEVVGAHIGADPALEVAVARQDRGRDQVALGDGLGNLRLERAGVADAGGAAIAHEVEADGVEIFLQIGGLEIGGHDLRCPAPARS
jgi:hypothetical protein